MIRDWAATARTGLFPRLHGVDAEAAVVALRVPVLAISFDDDRYTPHATLDHLVAKLAAASVTRERHRAVTADGRPVHFAWVRRPGTLADRIAAFAPVGSATHSRARRPRSSRRRGAAVARSPCPWSAARR